MKWILTCLSPVIGTGKRGDGKRPKYRDEISAAYGASCEVIAGNVMTDATVRIESYVPDDTCQTVVQNDTDYTEQAWTLNTESDPMSTSLKTTAK